MCIFNPPKPPPVIPAPSRSDTEIAANALAERRRLRAAVGRDKLILTGGQGAPGPANIGTKMLLGE